MPEKNIRVVSPFVGGAFGSALRTWPHVNIAASAARKVGRAVRFELTRREGYPSIGYRPRTEQHMQLGAETGRPADFDHAGCTGANFGLRRTR
jgi:xanthine dehydrogenase YagR molybdenum-binding subunit